MSRPFVAGAGCAVQVGATRAREVVDMALLLGWLQGAEHAALLGMLRQPNAVPLSQGRTALQRAGLYLELVRLLHTARPPNLQCFPFCISTARAQHAQHGCRHHESDLWLPHAGRCLKRRCGRFSRCKT